MIKLGIIMDSIAFIDIKKDSSFAILLEAQRRGYEIHYIEINSLCLQNGYAKAKSFLLFVKNDNKKWYELDNEKDIYLSELDVILMRKNPPVDINFIYATYILERAEDEGVLIINKPQSLRDNNEKIFATAWFSKYTPDTLVSCCNKDIYLFWKKYGDIILKPLNSMGGDSVFHVKRDGINLNVIINKLTNNGHDFCMVQRYIHAITHGDKRVFIIDGIPVPYCLARIPKNGEIRGNLAAGGIGKALRLSKSDLEIAYYLAPILKDKGLIFVGIDIIGNFLTEINITSPTCIQEIESAYPISITGMLMDAIESRLKINKI